VKAYIIEPPFEMYGLEGDRTAAAIETIADIVFNCLRADDDTYQFALTSSGPLHLETDEALRDWLLKSVDPNAPAGGDVRSASNCRCVSFGYDGQALLCLRHDDAAPISPDISLAVIEERSHYLAETDYLDGWIGISA